MNYIHSHIVQNNNKTLLHYQYSVLIGIRNSGINQEIRAFNSSSPIQQYSVHHITGQRHIVLEVALGVLMEAVGDVTSNHLPLPAPAMRKGLRDDAKGLQVVQVLLYGLVRTFWKGV